ncbi:adenosylcobinamide-GDP ribazoletransferase [Aminipila luticellarii]|uniref:Adenosylcobinamide-GDP ribazoletransferase n=1 Tax=Aminipila luticellarii TaxID=2507160 RepID=A0A410PXB5_9FIRM|nr:adenosylcobinamide-GDP ribazoletransferase [Aminipila luticellarii]QAT43591.1 adenosylcobinamide-GDP ribazoletransferase [Aminipila luticellarii]
MKYVTAFFMAWGNFFAVPCPCKLWDNGLRRLQLVFFPLIGILMGVLWYILYKGMDLFHLPLPLQVAALTIYPFAVSGFIHLDGFMDCCDAILSRRELEERQRILKDSHVGAFAVISVVLLFVVMFSAVWALLEQYSYSNLYPRMSGLLFIPVVSRACSGYGVLKYRPIGHSQYNASYDEHINKKYEAVLIGIMGIMLLLALLTGHLAIIHEFGGYLLPVSDRAQQYLVIAKFYIVGIAAAVTGIVHFMMMRYGRKQLGGMSGDIAGYALTIAECAGVLTLAVL